MTDISKEAVDRHLDPVSNPTSKNLSIADRRLIRAQAARIEELQSAQPYTYIGKDGKSVLARDLEDERDALKARIEELEAQCVTVKPLDDIVGILSVALDELQEIETSVHVRNVERFIQNTIGDISAIDALKRYKGEG